MECLRFLDVYDGRVVSVKGSVAGRCVSGHRGVSVGTKVCQWAQMRVSRHKGVLVGMKADQCAGSRASSWYKGVSVGMKVSVGKRRVNRQKACQ